MFFVNLLLGDDKNEKDPKKKTSSSYTGGEKSGLAVENPDDKKPNIDQIIN